MNGNDLNVLQKIDELKDSLTIVQKDMGEEITILKVSVGKLCVKLDTVKDRLAYLSDDLARRQDRAINWRDILMLGAIIIGAVIGVVF